ncbi:MAG: alpha/beta hydrolase [Treponema sp.]|nr:alpha/beta hydrolase [Candidatus Treponema equifaecale]
MSSSKDRQNAIKKLKALLFTPKTDVTSFRQKIDATFSSVFLPNNVDCTEKEFGGVKCDVLMPEICSSNRIMLYIHGGSFVAGSRVSARPFAASLANAIAGKVIVPEIRLAPAYPFPAALEDVQAVFERVYTEQNVALVMNQSENSPKIPEIIIASDTSGASIALPFVYGLKENYRAAIKKILLFSPWLSLSADDDMFIGKKVCDEVFTADSVRLSAEHYTYQENWSNPLVSPIKATREMLLGLPPVYIQMGEKEIYYDDVISFHSILTNTGVQCDLDIWPEMMPMFQLADEHLKESHLAIEKIGKLFTTQKRDDE